MMIGFGELTYTQPHFWKMATSHVHGSSLAQDLEQIRLNNIKIEEYRKTVLLLEQKPLNPQRIPQRINVIQSYKYHISQLEKENRDLRNKIDRC